MKAAGGEGGFRDPEKEKFPYEKIKNGEIDNLNQNCKEMYLNDDEFQQVLGMPPEEFYKLPQWKKRNLRQKNGLF